MDLGTYTESDINIGGGQEETIKAAIKEDFTRCAGGKRLSIIILINIFRVEIYYTTLNIKTITQSAKYNVRFASESRG